MSQEISVHGYAHSGGPKPRKPLVHVMAFADGGDLQSISFHPEYAERFCDAIMKAARAAKRNRSTEIKLKSVSDEI